jgi:redox-sensitive bicupin YhaK (pirin superfamily)
MSALLTPTVDVRHADQRLASRLSWLDSKHSFSLGTHQPDPANTHHGLLLVNNEDLVQPGTGFETRPHQDMEIVTWVLQGSLVHQDSSGHSGVIYPGLAQRMSAGTGILHSEKNDSYRSTGERPTDPVHFIQMWVLPDEPGVTPGYEQLEIDGELPAGGLVTVASGMDKHKDASAIRIQNRHAALYDLDVGEPLAAGVGLGRPGGPVLNSGEDRRGRAPPGRRGVHDGLIVLVRDNLNTHVSRTVRELIDARL